MQESLKTLTIQQVSQRLGVTKHTLRFWEKELEGVIVPLRTQGGQRRFTSDHLSVLEDIKRLKAKGLRLMEIKRIFSHGNDNFSEERISHGVDDLANHLAEIVRSAVYRIFHDETPDRETATINLPE